MFFLAVVLGGGLIWNAVDGLAGMLISDAMLPVIGLLGLYGVIDLVFVTKLVDTSLAEHAHTIVAMQLPLLVAAVVTVSVRYRIKGDSGAANVLAGIFIVGAIVGVIITNFLIKGAGDGSSWNAVYLQNLGFNETASAAEQGGLHTEFAKAYNHVAFGAEAIISSILAGGLSGAVAYLTTSRGTATRSSVKRFA